MSTVTHPTYDHHPHVQVPGDYHVDTNWDAIAATIQKAVAAHSDSLPVVAIDCYSGVLASDVREQLATRLQWDCIIDSEHALKPSAERDALVAPFNGDDDPIFGLMNNLQLADFFSAEALAELQAEVAAAHSPVLICGIGATLVAPGSVQILADMARWEEQQRHRQGISANIGGSNLGVAITFM